jgi:hypothetical protein
MATKTADGKMLDSGLETSDETIGLQQALEAADPATLLLALHRAAP